MRESSGHLTTSLLTFVQRGISNIVTFQCETFFQFTVEQPVKLLLFISTIILANVPVLEKKIRFLQLWSHKFHLLATKKNILQIVWA